VKQPTIAIIDYGVGNTGSVRNAIDWLGYKRILLTDDRTSIAGADALVLPGVGAFKSCADGLKCRGLDQVLQEYVMVRGRPILGICVGMQLMASESEENGVHKGLNWIPGRVVKLRPESNSLTVPHVGWNEVSAVEGDPLFSRLPEGASFYFDHSFHFVGQASSTAATCCYGLTINAAIRRDNVFGVQFHPEKSHTNGLKLFRAFFNFVDQC